MSTVKRKTQNDHLTEARAAKGKDLSPKWLIKRDASTT